MKSKSICWSLLCSLVIFHLLFSPGMLFGVQDEYRIVAANFLKLIGSDKQIDSIELLESNELEPSFLKIPVAYLVNLKNGGYLLIPASKDISPIKAYSLSSDFPSLPEGYTKYLLLELENHLRGISSGDKTLQMSEAIGQSQKSWEFLLNYHTSKRLYKNFQPDSHLVTTKWSNEYPYTKLLPKVNGSHVNTDCTCVAAAQLMKYHNYPPSGNGVVSYSWNGQKLKAVLFKHYHWGNMPDVLNQYTTPEYEIDEVARLIRDLTIASHIDFSLPDVPVNIRTVVDIMVKNFGYANEVKNITNLNADLFFTTIKNEIDALRPVLLELPDGRGAIIDGYSSDQTGQKIHLNFGRAWYSDDYYFLDQPDQLIYAPPYGYPTDPGYLRVYYNIQPCKEANCYTNLESKDKLEGLKITGRFDMDRDSDEYKVYLEGITSLSGSRGYYDPRAFYILLSDSNNTLVASNTGQESTLLPAVSTDLPPGKYTINVSLCSGTTCYRYDTSNKYNDYTVPITTHVTGVIPDDIPPVINNDFRDIILNYHNGPYKILVDAADEDNDAVSFSVLSTNSPKVDAVIDDQGLLIITPKEVRSGSKITVFASARDITVAKSFTVLVTDEDISWGNEFEIMGFFENQETSNRHMVILDGPCTIMGDRSDYADDIEQAFFTSVFKIPDTNFLIPPVTSKINYSFDFNQYILNASLFGVSLEGVSYFPYQEGKGETYVISVSCPEADPDIRKIAELIGVVIEDNTVDDRFEYNDTPAYATFLNPNQATSCYQAEEYSQLKYLNDDWYSLHLSAQGTLTAMIQFPHGNLDLELFNHRQECLGTATSPFKNHPDKFSRIYLNKFTGSFGSKGLTAELQPGNYFLKVYSCTGLTDIDYTLAIVNKFSLEDKDPPQITRPEEQVIEATGQATRVTYPQLVVQDSCDPCPDITFSPPDGSTFPVGKHVITATVKDESKNTSQCTFTINVVDTTAPHARGKDIAVQLNDRGQISISPEDVNNGSSDACGLASKKVNPDRFTCAEVGKNEVTLTVVDNNGNKSSCKVTVTVEDTIEPMIRCKENIAVKLDAEGRAHIRPEDVNDGSSDACGLAGLQVSPDSFNCNDLDSNYVGRKKVTLTGTDRSGNTSICETTVEITPSTIIPCLQDDKLEKSNSPQPGNENDISDQATPLTLEPGPCSIRGDYPNLKAFDDDWYRIQLKERGQLQVSIYFSNAEGDLDLMLFAARDKPTSQNCLKKSNSNKNDSESINWELQPGEYLIRVYGFGSELNNPGQKGKTNVQYRMEIEIPLPDTIPPVIIPPEPIKEVVQCGSVGKGVSINLGLSQVTDNCDPLPKVTNDAPALFLPGEERKVTWTATDKAGNTATAFQKVIVITEDTEPPQITCPADIAISSRQPKRFDEIILVYPEVSDLCDSFKDIRIIYDAPKTFEVGKPAVVNWTAIDREGNSASCSQRVFIAPPPEIPREPTPDDKAEGQPLQTTLRWFTDYGASTYKIYLGTTKENLAYQAEVSTAQYSMAGLKSNTQYYWRVVAFNAAGEKAEGPVWSFTTQIIEPCPIRLQDLTNLRDLAMNAHCYGQEDWLNHQSWPEYWIQKQDDLTNLIDSYWLFNSQSPIISSPVLEGKRLFFGNERGEFFCFNAANGEKNWRVLLDGPINASPAVKGDYVYVASANGQLYCLNIWDNSIKWNRGLDGKTSSSPLLAGGNIYLATERGTVFSLNGETGVVLWSQRISSAPIQGASLALSDNRYLCVANTAGEIFCLDITRAGDKIFWKENVGAPIYSTCAISGQNLYVGDDKGRVNCRKLSDGVQVWQTPQMEGSIRASLAVEGNDIYVATMEGYVYRVNALIGRELWGRKVGGKGFQSAPVLADGYLYIGNSDGRVYCLDALNGKKISEFITTGEILSSGAISDGRLFIGSKDGYLYCLGTLSQGQGDWPVFQHDEQRSGSTHKVKTYELSPFKAQAGIFASPAVMDGVIYAGDLDGHVYALRTDKFQRIWASDYKTGGAILSSPAVGIIAVSGKAAQTRLFVGSDDARLYCLNAATGKWIWDYQANGMIIASPTLVEDRVYFADYTGEVYCLDAAADKTARVIWHVSLGAAVDSSPTVVGDMVYVGTTNGKLFRLKANPATPAGEIVGTPFSGGKPILTTAAFHHDHLLIADAGGNLHLLRASDLSSVWRPPFTALYPSFLASPVAGEEMIYVADLAGVVYALDYQEGKHCWNFQVPSLITSSPALWDKHLYVGGWDKKLYSLSAIDGRQEWVFEAQDKICASPVVADGFAYIADMAGNLYQISLQEKDDLSGNEKQDWPKDWPMFRQNPFHTGAVASLSCNEEEENSGNLDIVGCQGQAETKVQIKVRAQKVPRSLAFFSFEIEYETDVLKFQEVAEKLDHITVSLIQPGRILVMGKGEGGSSAISPGFEGNLANLSFFVNQGKDGTCSRLRIKNPSSDLSSWSYSDGCFCIHSCNGDVNGDDSITPQDALLIFKCYLGQGQCYPCSDVNGDGGVSPADALCVFREYLGNASCLD